MSKEAKLRLPRCWPPTTIPKCFSLGAACKERVMHLAQDTQLRLVLILFVPHT